MRRSPTLRCVGRFSERETMTSCFTSPETGRAFGCEKSFFARRFRSVHQTRHPSVFAITVVSPMDHTDRMVSHRFTFRNHCIALIIFMWHEALARITVTHTPTTKGATKWKQPHQRASLAPAE